jgi:hypothetical protein
MAEKPDKRKYSIESLVLGIISVVSGLVLFLLMPSKPFGPNLIDIIDPEKQFLRYAFILFLLLLFGSVAAGTSIVAIIAGVKDYRGIDRGLYIDKGKKIYMAGIAIGTAGLCLLAAILIIWTVF